MGDLRDNLAEVIFDVHYDHADSGQEGCFFPAGKAADEAIIVFKEYQAYLTGEAEAKLAVVEDALSRRRPWNQAADEAKRRGRTAVIAWHDGYRSAMQDARERIFGSSDG